MIVKTICVHFFKNITVDNGIKEGCVRILKFNQPFCRRGRVDVFIKITYVTRCKFNILSADFKRKKMSLCTTIVVMLIKKFRDFFNSRWDNKIIFCTEENVLCLYKRQCFTDFFQVMDVRIVEIDNIRIFIYFGKKLFDKSGTTLEY